MALPALTMPRHDEILRISQSPEIAPWRFRNAYVRLIPWWLAESSAGIERKAFGQEKEAITPWVIPDSGAMFSTGSQQALIAFSEEPKFRNRQLVCHRLRRMQATPCYWMVGAR